MGKTFQVLDFEDSGIHGIAIAPMKDRLSVNCTSDGEIDAAIQNLKDDADRIAKVMKRELRKRKKQPLFGRDS
ncbi:MAG: hypothetical protein K5905_00175 [Roseibium sp.]|uniref:hypothetical protein n=1 Tax=Roseibium sp. TaxID=1936156 RepID=UPI002634A8CF|nr:hypothetical protein [Roseibium sp.]MCV0423865.1 hypothetical protein [Roseibium sp.]